MTRRVSSVTLKRGRRGARKRSRIVILASSKPISRGRAGATIGLEKSTVNKDVPLLCRARRAARSSAAAGSLSAGVSSFDAPDGEPPPSFTRRALQRQHVHDVVRPQAAAGQRAVVEPQRVAED